MVHFGSPKFEASERAKSRSLEKSPCYTIRLPSLSLGNSKLATRVHHGSFFATMLSLVYSSGGAPTPSAPIILGRPAARQVGPIFLRGVALPESIVGLSVWLLRPYRADAKLERF